MPLRRSVFAGFAVLIAGSIGMARAAEPKFDSKVVTRDTKGQAVPVSVDIKGAKKLYLVATDGGDGFGCDWADWIEPKLVGAKGEQKLTEMKWKSASTGHGNVGINKNSGGNALSVAGKKAEFGIGTHANSVIEFDLPADHSFEKFTAVAALDDQGTAQGCGSTVQFLVFTEAPDAKFLKASANAAPVAAGSRDPKDAVSGLDVAEGLEATLFASEASGMLSPTNIDIDHLGRVWTCEVVNYRHRNGERKEGDRILIVEDTNGDGVSDKQSVFYQGRDVDTALGICVLPTPSGKGTKVIVSVAPNVIVFTDVDGDSKFDPAVDKKEFLFTKVGTPQHDHSTHAFLFGPDGKFYWNVGNTGQTVHDKDGNIVKDLAGNEVRDNGKPYWGGMPFRCNLDGSEFEVLAHNFRNNVEVTVDSFGTLWQSDNDDDGNRGVRINFVMEFGNYGYRDEFTGAGWNTPRTNLEQEIPLRHWHLNDPGVVPNLLQTGAGSPTGICVYEGDLLPEKFRNQVIHCDAGPNVVRAYPATKSGAGYTAEIANVLHGARDNWFRPSDVCVAPDGSLIVADWYDPGVGGHRMGDAEKGRLFRVAPPKTAYKFPKVDVSTVEGAIAALKSPNLATRYLGWTALHEMGDKAEASLAKVYESDANPKIRARALWLLSKTPAGVKHVEQSLSNTNPDLRIVGLRAIREMRSTDKLLSALDKLSGDQSPEVRRECLVALAHLKSAKKPTLWASIAQKYDGKDRWYLEALGIGAGSDWDACLDAYLKAVNNVITTQAARDIIWRSRAAQTPALIAKLLGDSSVTAEEAPRYLRAFDFLNGESKNDALIQVAFSTLGDEKKTQFANAEAIGRLKGFDVSKNPQQKVALNRVLDGLKGTSQFVSLVEKFGVSDRYADLVALASTKGDEQVGIDAVRVLLGKGAKDLLEAGLKSTADNGRAASGLATALSNSADGTAAALLLPVVQNEKAPGDLRRQAIKGATRTKPGATAVLKLVEAKAFDDSFAPALAAALSTAPLDAAQQATVSKLFPAPAGKDSKPLPSIGELAKLKGNKDNGQKVFASQQAKCSSCHIVNGQGKEVGPNLSEIGNKLSRQAFFESIIFPSAGISHNYELYTAALKDGTVFSGIMISSTDDSVTLRNAESIQKTIKKSDLEEPLVKQKISIMPADVAKQLSQEELVDVVEYLTTLKKK